MPRVTLTKTPIVGPYPAAVAANSLDVTLTACDISSLNQFSPGGDDILLVQNTDAVSAYTFTLTSAPDPYGRSTDITTYSLAAGEIAAFRVKTLGWVQSDGKVYCQGSNAAIKFAVLALM